MSGQGLAAPRRISSSVPASASCSSLSYVTTLWSLPLSTYPAAWMLLCFFLCWNHTLVLLSCREEQLGSLFIGGRHSEHWGWWWEMAFGNWRVYGESSTGKKDSWGAGAPMGWGTDSTAPHPAWVFPWSPLAASDLGLGSVLSLQLSCIANQKPYDVKLSIPFYSMSLSPAYFCI